MSHSLLNPIFVKTQHVLRESLGSTEVNGALVIAECVFAKTVQPIYTHIPRLSRCAELR